MTQSDIRSDGAVRRRGAVPALMLSAMAADDFAQSNNVAEPHGVAERTDSEARLRSQSPPLPFDAAISYAAPTAYGVTTHVLLPHGNAPHEAAPLPAAERFAESERREHSVCQDDCRCVIVSSARGGVGCSTFASLLALAYAQHGKRTALVDADPRGGLEIVLGLEADPGLRLSQVRAPLGHIEPSVLLRELLRWEDVFVVPADPWAGAAPEEWERKALWRALEASMDVVVVDFGSAVSLEDAYERGTDRRGSQYEFVRLVELSVLGIMREKAFRQDAAPADSLLVAVPLRRCCGGRRGPVSLEQASVYLDADFAGTFPTDRRLERNIISGFGIECIPRAMTKLFESLTADEQYESDGERNLPMRRRRKRQ